MLDSLLDWHLRYGDARSARAAIAFLERGVTGTGPVDPAFAAKLPARWNAAHRQVAKLLDATGPQREGESAEARLDRRYAAIGKLPAVMALSEYLGLFKSYDFLASEYTRAAEYFLSPDLLADARRLQAPTTAAFAFIDARKQDGPVDAYLARQIGDDSRVQSPGLREMSLAVTEAAIGGDPGAIAAAEAVTRARFTPDLLLFLNHAYEADSQPCDVGDRDDLAAYAERCEENGFENDALGFWYQRSRLALVAQKNDVLLSSFGSLPGAKPGPVEPTIELFQRRAWQDGWRYGQGSGLSRAFDLTILSAAASLPAAVRACRGETGGRIDRTPQILDQLTGAQSMVNPGKDPRRYRLLAETFVQAHDAALACDTEYYQADVARNLIVLRAFLASYDDILAAER
jgi:hypothetical protein